MRFLDREAGEIALPHEAGVVALPLGAGVFALPLGAGDMGADRFTARGGLTLVAMGVGGAGEAARAGCGVEPEAVRFFPADSTGAATVGGPSLVT